MSDNIVTCACGQKNRVPFRKGLAPKCGKCGSLLNSGMNKVPSAKLQKYLIWAVVVLSIVLVVLLGINFKVFSLSGALAFLFVFSIFAMYGFVFYDSHNYHSQIRYAENTIHGAGVNNSNYKPGNWESNNFLARKASVNNGYNHEDDDAHLWDPTDPIYQFINL